MVGVGLILGLEASVVTLKNRTPSGVAVFAGMSVAYVVGVVVVAAAAQTWRPSGSSFWTKLSLLNGVGTALCAVGLYAVSRVTGVSIISTHSVRKVPWMPLWLAVLLVAGVLVGFALYLRRGRGAERVSTAERWMILLVAAPAAFFVLFAHLPGELGVVGSFEEGQLLVGAHQLLHGAFPWRDIILAHGIFGDALQFLPGLLFFEVSRWAAWAGYFLLVAPVYWLLLYGLVLYLTRGRWTYALLFLAVIVLGTSFLSGFLAPVAGRFLPWPLVVVAFGFLLRRPSWTRAAVFTGGLVALVVLTPEVLIFVAAFVVVLAVFELDARSPGSALHLASFPRLARCAATGLAWSIVLVIWLAVNNALDGFIFYFKTFVPAHILEGIPIEKTNALYFKAGMYVPISLALLYIAAMATAILVRRSPRIEDWVASVLAIGSVLYYAKFLGRADLGHLDEYLAFTAPFLVYFVYRIVDGAQSWLAERRWRSSLSAALGSYALCGALALGVLVPSTADLVDAVQNSPGHFLARARTPPVVARVGYAVPGVVPAGQFSDLRTLLAVIAGPDPRVWDFSNAPADVYFFAQLKLLTRYDNVSIAIEPSTQRDVISELRTANPDVIIYNSVQGLTVWDGLPNMVRHYDVSAWILDHYHPVVDYAGFLLYARNSIRVPPAAFTGLSLSVPVTTSDLYTDPVAPCDWGYVPNFFAQRPARGAGSQQAVLEGLGRHVIVSGRLSQGTDFAGTPVEAFLTENGVRVGTARIASSLSASVSGIGFGFEIDAPIATGQPVGGLAIWVRTSTGLLARVPSPGQRPSPEFGTIESQRTVWEDRLVVPPNAANFHWLELSKPQRSDISPDHFDLSLTQDDLHGIYFSTKSGAPRPYFVRLDNCSQWRAMPGATTVLIHDRPQPGLKMRFLS